LVLRVPLKSFIIVLTSLGISIAVYASVTVSGHFSEKRKNGRINQLIHQQLVTQLESLNEQTDLVRLNWLHTLNPMVSEVSGSLSWSTKKQQGVSTFIGLPEISAIQRYQLWI